MASIASIIAENNATFFDLKKKKRVRIWPRISSFVVASLILALLLTDKLTDFVNSINTVASILLGFGFSVLFYIAGTKAEEIPDNAYLEQKNKLDLINKLSKELFHNVSYFVAAASASLAFGMLVIAPEAQGAWIPFSSHPYYIQLSGYVTPYTWWINAIIRCVFFFLVIEAGYTFARIVGRVNLLFEKKIDASKRKKPTIADTH